MWDYFEQPETLTFYKRLMGKLRVCGSNPVNVSVDLILQYCGYEILSALGVKILTNLSFKIYVALSWGV